MTIFRFSPVNLVGSLLDDDMEYDSSDTKDVDMKDIEDEEEDDDDDEDRETITGEPRYGGYLSDLLGPDLPDDDDDDYFDEDDDDELEEGTDHYGTLAFRDPNDNEYLGGFELSHFNLGPKIPGLHTVDLRKEEKDEEDTCLK